MLQGDGDRETVTPNQFLQAELPSQKCESVRPVKDSQWLDDVLQGNGDRQAVTSDQFFQAELLHLAEPDAAAGEHQPEHGVCHPALLPAVPV